MTEIITSSFYDRFIEMCANSRKSIKLCAPYVKDNVISEILSIKHDKATVNLVTKFNLKDFHHKTSDVSALENFVEWRFCV